MLYDTLMVAGVSNPVKSLPDPNIEARVFEFRENARCAASGSVREQQSVAEFVEAVEATPDVKSRVFEFRYAARHAAPGSECHFCICYLRLSSIRQMILKPNIDSEASIAIL